jgi:hypothetical protein
LRALGASGVIGTEIPVYSTLAKQVGRRILEQLTGGVPLGQAFLQMRRELLRQYNPLGLAYTFYGNARLHLCAGDGCGVCAAAGSDRGDDRAAPRGRLG